VAFTVGDLIDGHYRVERRYAGGMGFVYIVRDEVVGKRFAIKQLPEFQAENKVLAERFRREASAWLLMDYHPNIVQAHSYHPRPQGPILILEFVDGPSLDQLLKAEKKISPVQVVRYARQFCHAMNYAHSKPIPDRGVGVLHRDIKPGNILITRGNQIKVTDFGLAKFEEGESKLTGEGQFVGTIAYSSPEQLRSAGKVTKSSDVYSFGAVLYQMLSGRAPFIGPSAAELYRMIIQNPPLPLGEICPDLDRALAGVVMRCLEKDAANRFADFPELDRSLAGMELVLKDRRDWSCGTCGYTSRSRTTNCPVCESAVDAAAPSAAPDAVAGWSCVCGARVDHVMKSCPKCGRARVSRGSVLADDDAPLPVTGDLVPLSSESAAPAAQAPSPSDTLWPARPDATPSPGDSHVGAAVGAGSPQAAAKQVWDPSSAQPCLVELAQRDKLLGWILERSNYTVGRDAHMRIRLKDPGVAGYQLFLVRLPCGWLAINRQPGSRVVVNGLNVEQRLLRPGDVLCVGSTWLAFSGLPVSRDAMPPIPGHWPERVGLGTQAVKSRGSTPTRNPTSQAALCVLELPGAIEVVTRGEPLRIGASPLCEVWLMDAAVAPIHALLVWQTDGPHLVNLVGSPITLADGRPVADQLIGNGDSIRFGESEIHVRTEGDLKAPARVRAAEQAAGLRRMALSIVAGPNKGQAAVLPTGQPVILGRHSDCDLSIPSDPYMSRRHLEIVSREGSIEAKDLGSRHGFAVGQTTSTDTGTARLGDVLRVGQSYFLVHYELGRD
jgi:pSer/pThr/pTyr-binding forkhead associated (FHA) protein/tRNA A-37 threonylcarbamoyl transferase component Bud32